MLWLKTFVVASGLSFAGVFFTLIMFWFLDNKTSKVISLFGYSWQFSSLSSFAVGMTLVCSPGILLCNYFVFILYTNGYEWLGDGAKVWPVQLVMRAAAVFTFFITTWLYRGELPQNGSWVGLALAVLIIIASVTWK